MLTLLREPFVSAVLQQENGAYECHRFVVRKQLRTDREYLQEPSPTLASLPRRLGHIWELRDLVCNSY